MIGTHFGSESTNPRDRRAWAHTVIGQYQRGEAPYAQAFEAAYAASQTRLGRESNFGRQLGGVVVDAYVTNHTTGHQVVSGLSPALHERLASNPVSYAPDVFLARSGDVEGVPPLACMPLFKTRSPKATRHTSVSLVQHSQSQRFAWQLQR